MVTISELYYVQNSKELEAGVIPVEKIITHKLPMSKFAEGLDAMRKGVGLEVILYPDEN